MQTAYGVMPEHLWACIGPGISQKAFEVGDEVYAKFGEAGFPDGADCSQESGNRQVASGFMGSQTAWSCLTVDFLQTRLKWQESVLIFQMMISFRHVDWVYLPVACCRE